MNYMVQKSLIYNAIFLALTLYFMLYGYEFTGNKLSIISELIKLIHGLTILKISVINIMCSVFNFILNKYVLYRIHSDIVDQ